MKIICCVNAFLLLSIFCWSGRLFAGDAPASKDATINGTFTWNGKKGAKTDIKVVLTPTATANEFTAVYTFTWGKDNHSWKGTFKRNPQTGEASGTGTFGNRTFTFKGKTVNGVLTCQHYETTSGKEVATGDISFKL